MGKPRGRTVGLIIAVTLALAAMTIATRSATEPPGEWRSYAATNAGPKYAPLDQINKENVKEPARSRGGSRRCRMEVRRGRGTVAVPTNYQVTPLMVGGLLYASAGDGSVVALHPATGAVQWAYVPAEFCVKADGEGPSPPGEMLGGRSANRGVAYWADGDDARVIAISRPVAGRARTRRPARRSPAFGRGGRVDLTQRLSPAGRVDALDLGARSSSSDLIVVGGAADGARRPTSARRHPRLRRAHRQAGLDVQRRSPSPASSATTPGRRTRTRTPARAGVWGLMSADDELGYVYVATETPSSRGGDFWGGQRPGNNLFAESLVCLDARTGKRVWHFQAVHHGIWDYDFNAPPNLVDITVDGRRIKAIAEVSKQAFVYVLDRVTGSRSGRSRSGRCRRATCRASGMRRRSPSRPSRPPTISRA